jgi:hypothetical protein
MPIKFSTTTGSGAVKFKVVSGGGSLSFKNSTSIVTAGLVLHLDAGNTLSYPGSGTTWTDIAQSKTFTLVNSPTYSSANGGYLSFVPASSQYATSSTSLTSSLTTFTMEAWHYYTGTNSSGQPCIITELYPGVTSRINFSLGGNTSANLQSGFFDGAWRTTNAYTLTANNWYHIVGTYDGAINKLYVNNSLVQNSSAIGNTPSTSQGGIRLMRRWDNAEYWGGRLAVVRIYNTALDTTQISQNYNTQRSRFGL